MVADAVVNLLLVFVEKMKENGDECLWVASVTFLYCLKY